MAVGVTASCGMAEGDPARARVAANGAASLSADGSPFAVLGASIYTAGERWVGQQNALRIPHEGDPVGGMRAGAFITAGGVDVRSQVLAAVRDGALRVRWALTPEAPLGTDAVGVSVELPGAVWAGAEWASPAGGGRVPAHFGEHAVFHLVADAVALAAPSGQRLAPMSLLLEDHRKWTDGLTLRAVLLGDAALPWQAGETRVMEFEVSADRPLELEFDGPVTMEESEEWVGLRASMDIAAGSAPDFSTLGLLDPPAGKHGWLRAVGDHFEFSGAPGKPVRFYGVNVVWSALYLDPDECDRFAVLLSRAGYNSVRIHHCERELVDPDAPDTLTFRPDSLDRLDYFVAAMKRRGISTSIDLFVSRPVKAQEVFGEGEGRAGNFEMLVPVSERAFANLCEFARRLLTHVNPYTGLAWKDDSASRLSRSSTRACSCTTGTGSTRARPLWEAAFSRWLLQSYGGRAGLAAAWGEALGAGEDPARGTVSLPARGLLPAANATDLSRGRFQSDTGEVLLDREAATLSITTPRTVGVFSRSPGAAELGPLRIEFARWGGALQISSSDGQPVASSRRLLLVHLTDLQNSGARFGYRAPGPRGLG